MEKDLEERPGILALLREACRGRKFTKVADAAGLKLARPSNTIRKTLDGEYETIQIKLADWALAETIYKDNLAQAYARLRAAGLSEDALDLVRKHVDLYAREGDKVILGEVKARPPGTMIEEAKLPGLRVQAYTAPPKPRAKRKDKDGQAGRAGELPPGYGAIEAQPRRVDRRNELATYHVETRRGGKAPKLPHWLNLAAGPGHELERSGDYLYFRELPDWQRHHSATIRGDSMADTLRPGDVVVLQVFDRPLSLEVLEDETYKTPLNLIRAEIPHDSIAVVSLNDEEPTIKRIKYVERSGNGWSLLIVADNPDAPGYPRDLTRQDKITFHALLKGIASKRRPEHGKRKGKADTTG